MAIKAVLFDMGYTLIKYDRGPEEVFKGVLESFGISKSVGALKKAFSKTEQEFKDLHLEYLFGKILSNEYWVKWNSTVLGHLDLPQSESLGRQVQDRWFNHLNWEVYPYVQEILSKLKQMELKIGLITTAYEDEVDLIFSVRNRSEHSKVKSEILFIQRVLGLRRNSLVGMYN